MSVKFPAIGNKVVAKVIEAKGSCTIGMQPGDEFELSSHKCGDFCGLFYKNISGWVQVLQLGGTFPFGEDPDVQVWDCPNPHNRVKVELRRIKE
ncbi:TIGR04076 family protein [Maridesulfovibrio ferrireducens]|uniref:TIGR04076 family protein n=1 Tax=Maridesulfovibrio ferrireducens TaxID=246191 RepID=A0A1G9JLI8_9BACT|nr:TIGR04076 family protein [Maridesulfovibrio ferrireducens]SDL38172.1 TIGR04076 family protein [Maridesulfovibrio ferrireducens]